jgi:hypothetical protein
MKIKIFDDLFSILHLWLGFLDALLYFMKSIWINIALLLTIIYFAYESLELLEDRDLGSYIGDIIEFLLGILLFVLLKTLQIAFHS